jgi:hypothetical protein
MIGISWGIFNRGLYTLSVFKEVPYGWFNRSVFISEHVPFGSDDDDEVHFVLDQQAYFNFDSTSSLKQ